MQHAGIEQVVGNPILLSGLLLLLGFVAGEEGFIVTHNRSVTLGKYKTKAK